MKFKALGTLSVVFALSLFVTAGQTLLMQGNVGDLYKDLGSNPDFSSQVVVNSGLLLLALMNAFLGVCIFQSESDGFFNFVLIVLAISFVGSGVLLWYVSTLAYSSVEEVLSTSTGI